MRLPLSLLVAAVSGFIALSYELLWYRTFSVANGALASSFPLLLGTYLLGIAAGAWAVRYALRYLERRETAQLPVLAACLAISGVLAYAAVPLFAVYAERTLTSERLPWVGLASAFLGATFPLVAQFGVAPDERAGVNVSYLYLANIVGSTLGTLITGFVLMDAWSLGGIALALLVVSLAGAALTFGLSPVPRSLRAAALAALAGVAALFGFAHPSLYDRIYERLLFGDKHGPNFRFSQVIETRSGVITVGPDKVVHGGGIYDGAVNIDPKNERNLIFRAYAVPALHPAPREVLMIGLASGSWAQVVATLPSVERLTIVEINPGYAQLIASEPLVAGLLTNPKVELIYDDARRWLSRTPERKFDFVVANTMVHWIGSSTHVLSQEFVGLVREHLKPGGVYYFNATGGNRGIKTAVDLFQDSLKFSTMVAASDGPVVFDKERWKSALVSARKNAQEPALDLTLEADQQALERLVQLAEGVERRDELRRRTSGLEPITDDNMGYEWSR